MDQLFSHSGATSEHLAPQPEIPDLTAYKASVQEEFLKYLNKT